MSKDYATRSGFKWTVNECLRLEREYDLLKMSVEDIALLHRRTPFAIMYKLDEEGIADFNHLYKGNVCQEAEAEEEEESEEEESDASNNKEYDQYNLRQQVGMLTKQLRSLTSVVYKFITQESNHNEMAHC
jgi:hypothetical protein